MKIVYLLLFLVPVTFCPAWKKSDDVLKPEVNALSLTIDDCLRMAWRDNLGLRVDHYNLPMSREAIRVAAGVFWSPSFYLNADYGKSESAPKSIFQPEMESRSHGFKTGFQWQALWTGAVMDLSYQQRYNRSEAYYATLSATEQRALWNPALTLSLTQPLLKGAWLDFNRAEITKAEIETKRTRQAHENLIQSTLLETTRAYWQLVYAREYYRVQEMSLKTAKDQLKITEQRIQARLAAQVERIANQADIARRKQDLIAAENQLRQAGDALKALIFPFDKPREWQVRIIPTSAYDQKMDFPIPSSINASRKAITNRADMVAAKLSVKNAEVQVAQAKNQTLPSLNLVSSYAVEDSGADTSHFTRNLLESQYPAWSIGLQFSYPLGNISARAEMRRAELALEQAMLNSRRVEVSIWQEVREAVRNLESLREEILAGRKSVRLAISNLQTEEEKFKVGKSISFEVNRRNDDLAEARARLVNVIVRFRTGIAALQRAMGELTIAEKRTGKKRRLKGRVK